MLAAEATFAGAVALPSREALADQVAPVTGDDREAMIAATARAELRLADLAADAATRRPEARRPGRGRASTEPATRPPTGRMSREAGEDESQPVRDAGPLPNEALFLQASPRGREAVREAERRYRAGGRLTDDEVAWLGLLLLRPAGPRLRLDRADLQDWQIAPLDRRAAPGRARLRPGPRLPARLHRLAARERARWPASRSTGR